MVTKNINIPWTINTKTFSDGIRDFNKLKNPGFALDILNGPTDHFDINQKTSDTR